MNITVDDILHARSDYDRLVQEFMQKELKAFFDKHPKLTSFSYTTQDSYNDEGYQFQGENRLYNHFFDGWNYVAINGIDESDYHQSYDSEDGPEELSYWDWSQLAEAVKQFMPTEEVLDQLFGQWYTLHFLKKGDTIQIVVSEYQR